MSCSVPFDKKLHRLGYGPSCELHDLDYDDGSTLWDKIKADLTFSKNIMKIGEIHSPFIAIIAFIGLSIWPGAYKRFYDKD